MCSAVEQRAAAEAAVNSLPLHGRTPGGRRGGGGVALRGCGWGEAGAPAMSDADVVEELRPGHALFAMVLGYAITFTAAVGLNDYLAVAAPLPPQIGTDLSAVAWVGWFLLVYVAFVFTARVVDAGLHNLYEMLWACNVAMVLGGVGLVSDRPRLVGAAWIMVSLDQTLWWIEVSMRVYRGSNHPKRWVSQSAGPGTPARHDLGVLEVGSHTVRSGHRRGEVPGRPVHDPDEVLDGVAP
eukprot:COSAG01_NODE_17959_length_1111_cov_2.000988_2_plen_238_part_01